MNKHLKLFANHSDYEDFIETEDFILPNVSYCVDNVDVHYNPIPDPYNGHTYVDLGLPSGTKWATANVGAVSETDYGNYYQYGKGAAQYAETSGDSIYNGIENPLAASVDTAVQEWGGSWHMPTGAQMQELADNTTYQWVTDYNGSGVDGSLLTGQNGNSVFFPAAGYLSSNGQDLIGIFGQYWGSSPYDSLNAFCLEFTYRGDMVHNMDRSLGFSVRPVVG